jgi:hypothetical protein
MAVGKVARGEFFIFSSRFPSLLWTHTAGLADFYAVLCVSDNLLATIVVTRPSLIVHSFTLQIQKKQI